VNHPACATKKLKRLLAEEENLKAEINKTTTICAAYRTAPELYNKWVNTMRLRIREENHILKIFYNRVKRMNFALKNKTNYTKEDI
jgi:hypothetical protein